VISVWRRAPRGWRRRVRSREAGEVVVGGGGTQAGRFARTGGDGNGALSGFNAGAGEKKSKGEPTRSCA
jgi:hypothetical protein